MTSSSSYAPINVTEKHTREWIWFNSYDRSHFKFQLFEISPIQTETNIKWFARYIRNLHNYSTQTLNLFIKKCSTSHWSVGTAEYVFTSYHWIIRAPLSNNRIVSIKYPCNNAKCFVAICPGFTYLCTRLERWFLVPRRSHINITCLPSIVKIPRTEHQSKIRWKNRQSRLSVSVNWIELSWWTW